MDASVIVLGFTGSIGSGCTFISKRIPEISTGKKYRYYQLSNIIRSVLKSEGNDNPTVQDSQDKGDSLRSENGRGYLIGELIKQIDSEGLEDEEGVIIDGIKNEGEVNTLRQFPNFYLFSVQADKELRAERSLELSKRFKSIEDFEDADRRDQREENEDGQQVKGCDYLSDVIIINNRNFVSAATLEKKQFVQKIYDRYIKLIENVANGETSPEIPPTVHELCMTVAYSLSKSSSCIKRKVGAVIVNVEHLEVNEDNHIHIKKNVGMPFIVSSGYNEVPLGSYKCVFHPDYQKCYRDYLQEEYSNKLLYCPKCGEKIKLQIKCKNCGKTYNKFVKICTCGKEIDVDFKCSKCGTEVFNEYIPGSKDSPGKLLDMCRSLHAEENALLKLVKNGGKSNGDLVLYVTTQPCNLCSNKIVSAGLRKVIYAEPYSMRESSEILRNGGVQTERFEGVKSSAYFKLYR